MPWLRRTLFLFGLACILAGGQARAHATLIEASPSDGAVVAGAPAEVRLRFNEPVSPVVVHFIDARGIRREVQPKAHDATISISLPPDLPSGTQVVSYRVISSDGHPVGGSLVFSIGTWTAVPSGDQPKADRTIAPILWLSRLAFYLGLFAGAGGAFFSAWIGPDGTVSMARLIKVAIGVGLCATVLSVGLQGLDALDAPLSVLMTGAPWREGARTSFGLSAAAAVLALLCAWSATRDWRLSRSLALLSLSGAGAALALSGHGSAAEPQWLTRPAVFIHGVGAAFWTGALLPLAVIVAKRRGASLPIVRRFSRLATPMVALMAVAGVILAVVQVETPSAILATRYGQVLLTKMAAVSGLLALAWLNRRRLTPVLATPTGGRNLVRSIVGEIVLVVAILGLVATWRFTPPPRALAAAAAEPLTVHFHTAPAMVELTLSSRRTGPVTAALVLMTGDFGPLDAKEVTLSLANPGAGIEPIERRAERAPDGTWGVRNLVVPVPGRWRVHIDVLISDFEKTSIDGDIDVMR